jgi:hypothetical protein
MTMSPDTMALTAVAPQVLLGNHLRALKLPTFAREYEKVAMESAQERADYPRYLLRLCELERIDRERRNIERRIRAARFPQTKSLDTFDFNAQPSLNKALVLELARCEWIEKRQNCIALGPSGTGKTHVSIAVPDPRPRGRRVEHHYLTRRSDRGSGSAPMRRCRTVAILSLGSGAVGVSSTESSPASRRRDEEARTRPGQARVKRLWRHDRLRIKHMAASPRISPASRRRTSWVSEQLASTSPSAAIMLPASSTMDAHTQSRSAFALRPTVSAA